MKLLKAVIGKGLPFLSQHLTRQFLLQTVGHTTRDLPSVTWTGFFQERSDGGPQLRRAISVQAKQRKYLRSMLSRRQLQDFVSGARCAFNATRSVRSRLCICRPTQV